MANLKTAPLALTPALTAKLTGDRPAYGKGVIHQPIEGRLVDRPRPSESAEAADA